MIEKIWQPDEQRVKHANITKFISTLSHQEHKTFLDYADLHSWSCENKEKFWSALWNFAELKTHQKWNSIYKPGKEFFSGEWFQGLKFNFAENLLRYRDNTLACIFCSEDGRHQKITYQELHTCVAETAAGLKKLGVTTGDRVVAILPNIPETIIIMLATASLGACFSSCSPDFGSLALMDRLKPLQAKVIFTCDAYIFKGKTYSLQDKILTLQKQLSAQWILIPYVSNKKYSNTISWHEFIIPTQQLIFASLPFNHPLYIMFSSGTTGKPKCIIHSAGGTLIQHVKELMLHTDIKKEDRFCFYTTCGWMMWNWMVSSLALGATLVLYEGSPVFPREDYLLEIIDQYQVNIFGSSAAYFAALEKADIKPKNKFKFNALKTILSTGSPLLPEQFDYIYKNIKKDICLSSISGGTDIISCFVLGNSALPVYRGECQCKGLGMAVEIYNAEGKSVINEPGELVCTQVFPSMPLGFWQDENNEKYRQAYFDYFPNVWRQGDYAKITEHNGIVMYGRADTTLNPKGVRIGSAEIYRPLILIPEIAESIVSSQIIAGEEQVILFVKLKENLKLTNELKERIKAILRKEASPHHVPQKIFQVPDIPKTLNGKLAETAVRNILNHQAVQNTNALLNPEALDYFTNLFKF